MPGPGAYDVPLSFGRPWERKRAARAQKKVHMLGTENPTLLTGSTSMLKVKPATAEPLFTCERVIGKGATATVFLGSYRGRAAAVKMATSDIYNKELEDEGALLQTISHPRIVRLLGVIEAGAGPNKLKPEFSYVVSTAA